MRAALLAILAFLALASVLAPAPAEAGGGPETTLVVVNADSPDSLRVANEYVRLRRIPATHVCAIEGVPTLAVIDVDTFRSRIWGPVKAFLERQGLLDAVDVIAYSADFPYGVDFGADKAAKDLRNPPVTPIASLTSMTYLARRVEAKDPDGYLDMTVNGYYRRYPGESGGGREMTDAEASLRNEALTHLTEKHWAEAATSYAKLLETWKDDPETYYNYACCLARAGQPDEAMKALAAAVAVGWNGADHTREDPDLETLRGRDEFRALLAKMESSASGGVQPAHGFRSRYVWTGGVEPVDGAGKDEKDRYWLSTLLAYTGPWGNSVPEALASLTASASSDGTHPDGTVYFLVNGDVRATTRQPRFEAAVAALRALGRKAEILSKEVPGQTGILPVGKDDVMGAVIGTAGFSWKDCKSRILPGAICEHLTSFGGVFAHGGQTKLTELIRFGAAGASGTVNEPYSIPHKFPAPHVQVHYAEGCSLAEAFYQSVWGPYQLLVVGDPLARPFATFAQVSLDVTKAPLAGTVALLPRATAAAGHDLGREEVWVDGVPALEGKPGATLSWDTTSVEDGAHEVRAVVVESGRIETRSFAATTVTVANGKAMATLVGPKSVPVDGTLSLSGRAPGAKDVEVLCGAREMAVVPVKGDTWKLGLPASRLGMGVVTLQARARPEKGRPFRSPFLEVRVDAPALRKAPKPTGSLDGLRCEATGSDGKPQPAFVLANLGGPGLDPVRKAIEAKAKGPCKSVRVDGEFEVKAAGLYQLDVGARGELSVEVDGKPLVEGHKAAPDRMTFAMANLDAGWHTLSLRLVPDGAPDLSVLLAGDVVAVPLQGKALRHAK